MVTKESTADERSFMSSASGSSTSASSPSLSLSSTQRTSSAISYSPSPSPSSFVVVPNLASIGSGLAGITGAALLYLYQCDLIYPSSFPEGSRAHVAKPSEYGMKYREERLKTPDGLRLQTYVMLMEKDPENAPTILYFHANAGNLGHRLPVAKLFYEKHNCNVVMLSYRGYGYSEGKPSEKGLRIDAQTVLDYVRSHPILKHTLLIAYGQSIGGAVAIDLVSRNENAFAGLMVENTFLSIRKLIPHVLPVLRRFTFLCHQNWTSESSIKNIHNTPVLFLSGACDELVPSAHMQRLHDVCATKQGKDWVQFPNGMHNDTCMQPGYFKAIGDFFEKRVLPRKSTVLEQLEKLATIDLDTKKSIREGRRKSTPFTPGLRSVRKSFLRRSSLGSF